METMDLRGAVFSAEYVAQASRIIRRDGQVTIINGRTGLVDTRRVVPLDRGALIAKMNLTPKELAIISCVLQGLRNKQIADVVHTSEQVVKNCLRSIFDKTGVDSRVELATYFHSHGLLSYLPETERGVPFLKDQK